MGEVYEIREVKKVIKPAVKMANVCNQGLVNMHYAVYALVGKELVSTRRVKFICSNVVEELCVGETCRALVGSAFASEIVDAVVPVRPLCGDNSNIAPSLAD